jgi:hypothetical protein
MGWAGWRARGTILNLTDAAAAFSENAGFLHHHHTNLGEPSEVTVRVTYEMLC